MISGFENMSKEELEAARNEIRERLRALKQTGKAAERKIATLARRRERYMDKVREIDSQIEELRGQIALGASLAPRRRGRRPKNMRPE